MRESAPDWARVVDGRMALAREWDRLVAEVRTLNGFENFLQPPPLADLLPAAARGPIAIINVSRWRCDALLVRTSGVEVVELPRLTLAAVIDKTTGYLRALGNVDKAAHDLHLARQDFESGGPTLTATRRYTDAKRTWQQATAERDATLAVSLRWLWDDIADPVLDRLGFADAPGPEQSWPRLWWCPTGPLTLLPLHAAGYHGDGTEIGRSVLDRVVSSYTPTLRALMEARRPPLDLRPETERMLIVSVPHAPHQVPLAHLARERDLLTSVFPARYTLLEGEDATSAVVKDELPRHRWAHFSCHGDQRLDNPSQGGLLMADGVLTTTDISVRQHQGEFAFLSACMTAVGGVSLADEAITLAAALHHTGYRHVIGTLWTVYDETAADVAELVYAELTSTGAFTPARTAQALHTAVRHLRDVKHLPPSAWTPFAHTGP
jgi:CHAT domain